MHAATTGNYMHLELAVIDIRQYINESACLLYMHIQNGKRNSSACTKQGEEINVVFLKRLGPLVTLGALQQPSAVV